LKLWIENTSEMLATVVAEYIAEYIRRHPDALMCFAAGDTPLKMLMKLVQIQACGEVNLASVRYVGLDEWQGISYETKGSCCQVMRDCFYTPAGIPEDRMRLWNGRAENPQAECARMNAWIEHCGGIGLALLGIGMNGHIGFNEPGAPMDLPCHIVALDQVTAEVGRKYFDGAVCSDYGMTIGMPWLLESDETFLMATGTHKAPIVRKAVIDSVSLEVPASQLQKHPKLTVCLDHNVWQNL